MKKRVYIAYTGGTIGMTPSPEGYVPTPGYLQKKMEEMSELKNDLMPEYDVHEYHPLLDSSNMTPENWVTIAADIEANYKDYDGFVVLHGTDTMAYTASALAYMLEGLEKPVIITGSQIPLCEVRNDARENLITAIMIAANYRIPEVCLYFGDRLLRGCRAVKVHADQLDAFASPNFPPLGAAGVDVRINWELVLPPRTKPIQVNKISSEHSIATLRLFPGITAAVVENILQPPLKGMVLEMFGVGNGPGLNQEIINAIRRAIDRGVVVVAVTQCWHGAVSLGSYAAGSAFARAGVISGFDMTTEAAVAKLFYLFSLGLSVDEVKRRMVLNICGELSAIELAHQDN